MHRLAEFEQYKVRDVDHWADRAEPGSFQPFAQPLRRGTPIVEPPDHTAGETGAARPRHQFDGEAFGGRGLERFGGRRLEWQAAGRRHFARDPTHRHGIAPIGRDADLEQRLIEPQIFAQRRTERRILAKLDDAFARLRQPQFTRGTQHALRFDAAQLRLADGELTRQLCPHHRQGTAQSGAGIVCAADHLQFRPARVDAAHAQFVRLRMGRYAADLRHHHAAEGRRHRGEGFDFEAEHGQAFRQFTIAPGRIDPAAQPGNGQPHL